MARKTYSEEFRRDAVELYRLTEGARISEISGDLGITDATLSAWIKAAEARRIKAAEPRSPSQMTGKP